MFQEIERLDIEVDVEWMMNADLDLGRWRLAAQHICGGRSSTPLETVESMGAVQAQDYLSGMWAVGLRTKDSTLSSVEKALSDKEIVRSPLLRNTIHIVPAANYRWMLGLLGKRMRPAIQSIARSNGVVLDKGTMEKGHRIIAEALHGGRYLTRPELYGVLREQGMPVTSFAGLMLVQLAMVNGLVCFGPRDRGKQLLALLDDWIPQADDLPPDEALSRLAFQYFKEHGPAMVEDFAWWSGLSIAEARRGLGSVRSRLDRLDVEGRTYWLADSEMPDDCALSGLWLLPSYDEYTVGYRDRSPIFDQYLISQKTAQQARIALGNVMVADGKIIGSWKRTMTKEMVHLTAMPFRPLSPSSRKLLKTALDEYEVFLGRPLIGAIKE
jgi:Winged helix DNA-binding domain